MPSAPGLIPQVRVSIRFMNSQYWLTHGAPRLTHWLTRRHVVPSLGMLPMILSLLRQQCHMSSFDLLSSSFPLLILFISPFSYSFITNGQILQPWTWSESTSHNANNIFTFYIHPLPSERLLGILREIHWCQIVFINIIKISHIPNKCAVDFKISTTVIQDNCS